MNALSNQVLVNLCVKNAASVWCFLALASSKQQGYHLKVARFWRYYVNPISMKWTKQSDLSEMYKC